MYEYGGNMNFEEQKNKIEVYISNKEFDLAKKEVYKAIEKSEIKNIEDEKYTYFCFNSYLELMLYVDKYNPKKPNKAPKTNMAFLYYILGYINVEFKEHDEALRNLNESLKWNPVDLTVLFEKAECYKAKGDLERFKAEVEKTYQFITYNSFLAKYYRAIGYYYVEKNVYNVANVLNSMAFDFATTEQERKLAINELMFIAQQEKREVRKSDIEETKELCEEYNIPIGYSKRTVGLLLNEYQRLLERDGMSEQVKMLSRNLYEITQDTRFMIRYTVKDEETGISVQVPESWGVLRKSEFEKMNLDKNTLFIFSTTYNENISVVIDNAECGIGQFTELYRICIDNMKQAGIDVLAEFSNRFDDGFKLRQAIVEVQKVRMIQNYVRVNNKLINISWAIPKDKEPKEMIELLNNGIAMQVVLSVQGDNDKKQNENILTESKKFVYNQNIWRMSLEQLEEAKGLLYATKYEMQTRIDIAEYPYINPEFIEEMNNTTEKIKEIENMIEWKKYLQDVNEISITIGKNIYRIKTDMIKHFSSDNTMLDKRDISMEEFKNIVFNLLPYMYDWNKSYVGKELVKDMNWSILIKADNHDMKRFSGNNNYPITWNEFYNMFVYAIERSDITFFDGIFIKALIYLVLATQEEKEQSLSTCMQLANNLDLEQIMNQLPLQHPARVLFKTLDNLTDMQYTKLLIETTNILSIFIQDYPEENNKILFTITSEQDIDKIASRMLEHYNDLFTGRQYNYDKLEAVAICMNEEYSKNGINQAVDSYIRVFVDNIIETNKQDRFWSDSARDFLALLILSNLVSKQKVSIDSLKEQTKESEFARNTIKDNLEKFDEIPDVKEFMSVITILDSDKPLKSLVEITYNSLNKFAKLKSNNTN